MKAGRYFNLEEYSRSETANRLNIDNTPSAYQIGKFMVLVATVLDNCREALGKPISISSGYRCEELNRKVGGVSNSQHLANEDDIAVDLVSDNLSELYYYIVNNCEYDQCIMESKGNSKWIHLSLCIVKENRKEYFSINK